MHGQLSIEAHGQLSMHAQSIVHHGQLSIWTIVHTWIIVHNLWTIVHTMDNCPLSMSMYTSHGKAQDRASAVVPSSRTGVPHFLDRLQLCESMPWNERD